MIIDGQRPIVEPPAVGRAVPHDSANGHVTGTATFLDDVAPQHGELCVGFLGSPVAHGKFVAIDLSAAWEIPGVVGLYTHRDIPGERMFGPILHDEPVLVIDIASYIGQPIVLIAAEDEEAIEQARKAIRLEMEELPPVFSIDDAIAKEQFLCPWLTIQRGDPERAMAAAHRRLSGVLTIGGQEHFYLESQIAIVYPGEGRQLTVHTSTQHTTEIQVLVAKVLGIGQHEVVSICKRMGGGFGGKETQAALPAILAALVAHHTRRPARIAYSKDLDMQVTGKRHPYQCRYEAGFDDSGRILALRSDFYSNGGLSLDLSGAVLERTLLHADNAYYLPDLRVRGRIVRTNLPSNTAFRGFGGPQGVIAIENIMEEIAADIGADPLDVRRRNCYGVGERNVAPYGQAIENNVLPELFEQLVNSSDYIERRRVVAEFNATSRLVVRGLSFVPVKFGISFTKRHLNQANALVNIYIDGTIQVSTGGTEMGQGLNTKVRQLVADEFGIPWSTVMLMSTSTERSNNTSPTAASAGTDLNGTAAVYACRQIKERLNAFAAGVLAAPAEGIASCAKSIRYENGRVFDRRRPHASIPFGEMTKLAWLERVDLGARGFYATPSVDFNRETGKGNPFLYFTNGAAVAEVEIDRFTGEMIVPRVDILMDLGRPINPGIDRGQVIGGFIQGMGWATTEELRYSERGELLSHSPTTYKIPNITDTPKDFRFALLANDCNTCNIAASKAVGEPPLMLGIAVWTAVKDALRYARPGVRCDLRLPATGEEILRHLDDMAIE